MSDRRACIGNGRVAAAELRGQVTAARFVPGTWHRIRPAVVDLCAAPGGARDRQLLHGARVRVLEVAAGWAFAAAARDGYAGYLPAQVLGPDLATTHRVSAAATHLYPAADLKRPEAGWLSLGSELAITGTEGAFARSVAGLFVPAAHLRPLAAPEDDPVAVAERLLGVPYLWGGNSAAGIDCSGLVQAACHAAGIACPGDSDQQEASLGETLPRDAEPRRGDLVFWRGHVGWMRDAATLLHANAQAMAVASEPLETAVARIAAQGGGAVTRRARLAFGAKGP